MDIIDISARANAIFEAILWPPAVRSLPTSVSQEIGDEQDDDGQTSGRARDDKTVMDGQLLPDASRHVNTKTKTADWMVEYSLDESKSEVQSAACPVRALRRHPPASRAQQRCWLQS